MQAQIADMANQPFARTAEDPQLEVLRKREIREGDPMADYFRELQEEEDKKRIQGSGESTIIRKPVYKGPNAPANRFGIRPGYRWDGVDRGNGFDKKLLLVMNNKQSLKTDEYRWAVSDM